MIIGIDAREISKPDTGTGMYVVNLIKSISKIDKINKYILFVNKNSKLDAVLPLNFQYYEIIYFFNSKFEDQIVIPIAIWKSGIEYYHVIHHDVTPFFTNKPLIITVLDIAWIDIPSRSSRLFQKYYYYINYTLLL